jgi:hypothetical protein
MKTRIRIQNIFVLAAALVLVLIPAACENPSGSSRNAPPPPQQTANEFKTDYATILARTIDNITIGDERAVDAALAAYAALGDTVKALLTTEKATLDGLKTKINELKASATPQALADAFKASHAAILAKTAATVALGDEGAVDAALAAYDALDDTVKALLTAEKTLLDGLKANIEQLMVAYQTYSLAAYTLKTTGLAAGTQANTNELLTWTGQTWTGAAPLTVANAESGVVLGGVSLTNTTAVFVTSPLTGAFTWKAKIKLSGSGSGGLIAGALTDPTVAGRTVGTRFMAGGSMRNVWHRPDNGLGTGTDNTGKSLDPVYLFELSRSADGVFTGKVTDAATGAAALTEWTVSSGTGTGNFHADLGGGKALYPGFFVGTATVTVSEMTLVQDIDYTGPTPQQATQIAANTFLSTHSAILAKTAATVALADKDAYEAAVAAYTALPYSAKLLADVVAAWATLDSLKTTLDELAAAANNQQTAGSFRTAHAAVLAKTVDTIEITDEPDVDAALTAYTALSDDVKALLTAEKTLLDSLETKIDELKAAAGPQALADAFKTTCAAILAKTTSTVTVADKAAVDAALAEYAALSDEVKALLTAEKTLLDNLKTAIDAIIASAKKLVIKSQSANAGNTPDTAAGESFLLLTESSANTWTWSGTTVSVTNANGAIQSSALRNGSMVYLDTSMTSTYTFTAKIGLDTTAGYLLFGEIANPSTAVGNNSFKNFAGFRHQSTGAARGYYINSGNSLATKGDQYTLTAGIEYTYTVNWNASTSKYTVSITPISGTTRSVEYGPAEMGSDFSSRTAAYHPGMMLLSSTISISEVTLTVTP